MIRGMMCKVWVPRESVMCVAIRRPPPMLWCSRSFWNYRSNGQILYKKLAILCVKSCLNKTACKVSFSTVSSCSKHRLLPHILLNFVYDVQLFFLGSHSGSTELPSVSSLTFCQIQLQRRLSKQGQGEARDFDWRRLLSGR